MLLPVLVNVPLQGVGHHRSCQKSSGSVLLAAPLRHTLYLVTLLVPAFATGSSSSAVQPGVAEQLAARARRSRSGTGTVRLSRKGPG